MQLSALHLLPVFFFFFLVAFPPCDGLDPLGHYCSSSRDQNTTRTISANIASVLGSLVHKASTRIYATAASGKRKSLEKVYGRLQCRRDVNASACSTCATEATRLLPALCQGLAGGRIWFDYCSIRYANADFLRKIEDGLWLYYANVENASATSSEQQRFQQQLGKLMDGLQAQAVSPGNRGLGKGRLVFNSSATIYGLAQCTEDMNAQLCAQCISGFTLSFPTMCPFKTGCTAVCSSCYVRYEIFPFFFPLSSIRAPYTIIRGFQ